MTKFKVMVAVLVTAAASASWGINQDSSWSEIFATHGVHAHFPTEWFPGGPMKIYHTCIQGGNLVANVPVCAETQMVPGSGGQEAHDSGGLVCTRYEAVSQSIPLLSSRTACYASGGREASPEVPCRSYEITNVIVRDYNIAVTRSVESNEYSSTTLLFKKPFSIPNCEASILPASK